MKKLITILSFFGLVFCGTAQPAAPVATEATQITTNSFVTNWEPVAGADYYLVSRDGIVPANATPANSFEYTGLQPGSSYTFRVRAVDGGIESAYSNVMVVVTEIGNSIKTTSFDETGQPVAKSANYYDYSGRLLQSQAWDRENSEVFASEPLYDRYDKAVGQTLAAPIGRSELGYEMNFVTQGGGQPLAPQHWDGNGVPVPVDTSSPLGQYYSSSNPDDAVAPMSYPYAVSNFYQDGTGENKSQSLPGNNLHLYGGKVPKQKTLPVFEGELRLYRELRNLILETSNPKLEEFKKVTIDPNGNEIISYFDDAQNLIASAVGGGSTLFTVQENVESNIQLHVPKDLSFYFPGTVTNLSSGNPVPGLAVQGFYEVKRNGPVSYSLNYIDFTYNFYDNLGRLVASMTPLGVEATLANGVPASKLSLKHTTLYTYDFQGRLTKITEPDAGVTEYRYRKDGQIRYSQNAEQRIQTGNIYSYTNYDGLGRPIESGECSCTLSFTTADVAASVSGQTQTNVIYTYYDDDVLPSLPTKIASQIGNFQEFTNGAVASTESDDVRSWYSYDEQGRITWLLQHLKNLPVALDAEKYYLIQYEYDFLGNVTEVAFQPQTYDPVNIEVNEAMWHRYTYDGNQRLQVVETSIDYADWYEQARYHYYKHGPLERVELATDLQGIDYTYTPQGWLKAINHPVSGKDPGGDGTNGIPGDAFGMTLEYFEGDYESQLDGSSQPEVEIASLDLVENDFPQQYNGNIRATIFQGSDHGEYVVHDSPQNLELAAYEKEEAIGQQSVTLNPGFDTDANPLDAYIGNKPFSIINDEGTIEAYAFTYDQKNQLTKAKFGSANDMAASDDAYDVVIESDDLLKGGYDANGNIQGIKRYDEDPSARSNDFEFNYDDANDRPNRLLSIPGYISSITYNKIGQVIAIDYADKPNIDIEYDVTGKVTAVKEAGTPIMEVRYDDRGFRLMKRAGNLEQWYVRDASGQIMAIYHHDTNFPSQGIAQIELPIYGSSKIGTTFKNPDHYKYIYELSDHLGNVRALVTKLSIMATASMEVGNQIDDYEEQYFDNLDNVRHQDVANSHNGSRMARTNPTKPIGPTITMRVRAGDIINLEAFAKFGSGFDENIITSGIAGLIAGGVNGTALGVETLNLSNGITTNVFNAGLGAVTPNTGAPKAYIQYILLDNNFGYESSVGLPVTSNENVWQTLALNKTVHEDGYLYAYLVNESNIDVFFDDFTLQILGTRVIRSTDYYPFGAVAKQWDNKDQAQQEAYRHGYQGEYSEKDEETDWNTFELRMYDPLIGRFLQVDPESQFASSYLGMGNNPVNGTDPDGGWFFGLFGSTSTQRQELRRQRDLFRNGSDLEVMGDYDGFRKEISTYYDSEHEEWNTDYFQYTFDRDGSYQVDIVTRGGDSPFLNNSGNGIIAPEIPFVDALSFGPVGLVTRGKTVYTLFKGIIRTSSKSTAPSKIYTIYDRTGKVYKYGVTGENLIRANQSLRAAPLGSKLKVSISTFTKYEAHLYEKYMRSLHFKSTGIKRLFGMKVPFPVNF